MISGISRNGKSITPLERLLTYLYHIGCNVGYYHAGTNHGMSRGAVCESIKFVNDAIFEKVVPLYIKYPDEDMAREEARLFSEISKGFPPVIWSALGGTHCEVRAPVNEDDTETFRNRHHYLSLNVMVVVGASGRFYYIHSSTPGSQHDSRIAEESKLFQKLREGGYKPFIDSNGDIAIIIADSAYKSDNDWMAVPFTIAETLSNGLKYRFNVKFKRARNCVERFIGVVKARFPILDGCIKYVDFEDAGRFMSVVLLVFR